jgi:hypothetical protein
VIPISLADTGKLICRKALTKRNGDLILCWLIFVRTRKSRKIAILKEGRARSMAERTDHLLGLRIEFNIMVCHLKRESCRRIITPASIREVAMRRSGPLDLMPSSFRAVQNPMRSLDHKRFSLHLDEICTREDASAARHRSVEEISLSWLVYGRRCRNGGRRLSI